MMFPSARLMDSAELYGRMPYVNAGVVGIHLLSYEPVPNKFSKHARVSCCAWRFDGEMPIYIKYYASVETYLRQRDEIFGTSSTYCVYFTDNLSDRELAFTSRWRREYGAAYPFIRGVWFRAGSVAHNQLADLLENGVKHREVYDMVVQKPPAGLVYRLRIYTDGGVNTDAVMHA